MPWLDSIIPSDSGSLQLWDVTLRWLHAALVLFLICGWMIARLRRVHLVVVGVVWLGWLGLGLYVGHLGYCVLTDLQWRVKAQLEEQPLPPSYIEYEYQQLGGGDVDNTLVAVLVAVAFVAITLASLWVNRRRARLATLN